MGKVPKMNILLWGPPEELTSYVALYSLHRVGLKKNLKQKAQISIIQNMLRQFVLKRSCCDKHSFVKTLI